jgi:hypothetical protein
MDDRNFEVTFADGVLTIKGEKQEEREEKKKGYHMRERSFGSFERTFEVPDGIDIDKIKTSVKKGKLPFRRARGQGGKKDRRQGRLSPVEKTFSSAGSHTDCAVMIPKLFETLQSRGERRPGSTSPSAD